MNHFKSKAGDADRIALFETIPVRTAVLKLSVPTILSCLVMVLYSLADTAFVGMLDDPVQTAAVTLVSPVILAFNAVNNLFGVGSSSLISRALGCRDYDLAKRASSFGLWMAIFSGTLFSILVTVFKLPMLQLLGADDTTRTATDSYLFWTVICGAIPAILNVVMGYIVRSEGSALHASIGTMSGCLLNVALDPLFIFVFGMGAAGAGLATFISNGVACVYFLVLLLVRRGRTFISISPKDFRPDGELVRQVMVVGIPAAIQNLLNVVGMTVLNNLAAAYSSEVVAAAGIAHKVAMVPMYVSMGFGQGVTPLVGYNFASGNRKRMKEAIGFTVRVGVIFMTAATALLWIFAPQVVTLFMHNEQVVESGTVLLRGMALAQPFLSLDFLGVGIFQACGMGITTLVFAVLRKAVLEIPAEVLLNSLFGLAGLSYAQLVAEAVLAAVALVMLRRLVSVK